MLEKIKEKWEEILLHIKEEHELSDVSFKTWLLPTEVYSMKGDTVQILVPDIHFLGYMQKKYGFLITVAIAEITGIECSVDFITREQIKEAPAEVSDNQLLSRPSDVDQQVIQNANLNPRYTFDTFVVGANNNLAHAASLAVAESPGEIYNPLFIYGGVGLGKTHLMHSIGHFILKNNPKAKILYVTSEKFTNELIDAIRNKNNISTTEFREKYRNNDVLLIDDIQFIIGKESTQEEFFHTFNCLYEAGKQIVVTSDRPPKEMKRLDDRLCTRLEGGLLADVQPPDLETRTAIIRTKAAQFGMILSEDVVQYIAENITSNVRQLEGVVKRLTAYRDILDDTITVDSVKRAIRDVIRTGTYIPTPDVIIEESARSFQLTGADLRGQSRSKKTAMARQIAMYLMRNLTNLPLKEIGEEFGGRNHATVLSSIRKVEELLKSDPEIAATVRDITSNINSKN